MYNRLWNRWSTAQHYFEVTVSGRCYFAFSDYSEHGDTVVSYCHRTLAGRGWSHDVTVRNWACFR